MTQSKHTAERLARYYAEAIARNPKATIYEAMKFAVQNHNAVENELLEALEIITQRAQGCLPATPNLEDHPLWQAIMNANKAIKKAKGEA